MDKVNKTTKPSPADDLDIETQHNLLDFINDLCRYQHIKAKLARYNKQLKLWQAGGFNDLDMKKPEFSDYTPSLLTIYIAHEESELGKVTHKIAEAVRRYINNDNHPLFTDAYHKFVELEGYQLPVLQDAIQQLKDAQPAIQSITLAEGFTLYDKGKKRKGYNAVASKAVRDKLKEWEYKDLQVGDVLSIATITFKNPTLNVYIPTLSVVCEPRQFNMYIDIDYWNKLATQLTTTEAKD